MLYDGWGEDTDALQRHSPRNRDVLWVDVSEPRAAAAPVAAASYMPWSSSASPATPPLETLVGDLQAANLSVVRARPAQALRKAKASRGLLCVVVAVTEQDAGRVHTGLSVISELRSAGPVLRPQHALAPRHPTPAEHRGRHLTPAEHCAS